MRFGKIFFKIVVCVNDTWVRAMSESGVRAI